MKRIKISVILILLILIAVLAIVMFSQRSGLDKEEFLEVSESLETVESSEITQFSETLYDHNENVVFFYQKDERWKEDSLGNSIYKMNDSGCLTACIASAMVMQELADKSMTPKMLNKMFSDCGVYDNEGNIQWEALENATENVDVVLRNAEEMEMHDIDKILEDGCYPIIRVRVGGSGSYHYVLIADNSDGDYWCMDPLSREEELKSLSEYGNKIYAVRYLKEKI